MIANPSKHKPKKWAAAETLFVAWAGAALAALIPVTLFLQGSFPMFTVLWLAAPLGVVALSGEAARVGFRRISWRTFLSTTAINLGGLLLVTLLFEPWSGAYRSLVREAVAGDTPDTTFAWLARFQGLPAWGGLLLFSGLVTIFAEELFFRGWLLQAFQRRMKTAWAIALQAALFTLPQGLAALLLPPLQGVVYAAVYSFLAVGVIGGWAAARTGSIWPSLASAVLWNAILAAWAL